MGPFYVEWVESRAVIPAVKYVIVHKIVSWELPVSSYMGLFYVEWVEHGVNP